MSKNKILMDYPSSWWGAMWREALPSGNGEIGAAVYGAVHEERVLLTHGDLWWKGLTLPMPDVSHELSKVRSLMMKAKPRQAAEILPNALLSKAYNPVIASPLPLGDLLIKMPASYAFKKYKRSLDMNTGEINVSWLDGDLKYSRKLFVSRADNMIVCKISKSDLLVNNGEKQVVTANISLDFHDRRDAKKVEDVSIQIKGKELEDYLPKDLQVRSDQGYIYYSARNDDQQDFGAVLRVVAENIADNSDGSLQVTDDNNIIIYIKLFVKGNREESFVTLHEELARITDSYEMLLKKHEILHSHIMNAASLDLYSMNDTSSNESLLREAYGNETPLELIEKMWAYGRYLLISSSKEGGHPCHLYGLWCGEYEGMWAFNMLNENIQMIYWQALSGNMPQLMLAVFDYYESLMADFRENARKLYGCRGIFIPAPTAPDSGLLKHVVPHIIHWTGGAGWLAQHYYDYYLFTGDIEFLKERAIPFMVEVALFYEDFFTIDDEGYFVSCPSNSPENSPGNYWKGEGMGTEMETTINATMDFAITKELLTHLIEGCLLTDLHKDKLEKWRHMLNRIPAYQVNKDGAIKEWMHDFFTDNYHHRHESHIYPVFPGTEVTRMNNKELFKAFEIALEKRLLVGLKEQSGWSLAHMANNYARMGKGNQALECIETMTRSCVLNNLYTSHNDWRSMGIGVDINWAPIQLDANMGISSAINEMLMFSIPGTISILPALPDKWRKGKIERLLARGAIEVSIKWNLDKKYISIKLISKCHDKVVDLIFPQRVHEVSILENGKEEKTYIKNIHLKKDEINYIKLVLVDD